MVKLNVISKGNRYVVTDHKERTIYNIKQGMGGKTHLINTGGYKLYHFTGDRKAKKPVFNVFRNDKPVFTAGCTSLFLDPGFVIRGEGVSIDVVSQDRKKFDIMLGENNIGTVIPGEPVKPSEDSKDGKDKKDKKEQQETRYELDIDEKYFDDYIPLIAVFIDIAFGELNKG